MTHLLEQQNGFGIKVCGLRTEEDVDIAVGAGANAIGFVFAESSPRYIKRQDAQQLLFQLPDDVLGVAVVQNYGTLADFSDWNGWLQLCGDEDETEIANAPKPVIRAIKWDQDEVLRWDACPNIEALLVDGSTGGLGESFDIAALVALMPTLSKPIIIAGGLNSENVVDVLKRARPTAVDVSSGIESTKGVKDHQKMCDFINTVKNCV